MPMLRHPVVDVKLLTVQRAEAPHLPLNLRYPPPLGNHLPAERAIDHVRIPPRQLQVFPVAHRRPLLPAQPGRRRLVHRVPAAVMLHRHPVHLPRRPLGDEPLLHVLQHQLRVAPRRRPIAAPARRLNQYPVSRPHHAVGKLRRADRAIDLRERAKAVIPLLLHQNCRRRRLASAQQPPRVDLHPLEHRAHRDLRWRDHLQ